MHLILSYFNNIQGPSYLFTSHPNLAESIRKTVLNLMDSTANQGFTSHTYEDVKFANYLFEIDSEWARGKKEIVMITIVVDPIQHTESFKTILKMYGDKITSHKDAYKGLYLNSNKLDPEIMLQYDWIDNIFNELLGKCNEMLKEVNLGLILVIGLFSVGKTSIINRLSSQIYNPDQKPTLGIQITKLLFENYKVFAHDIGGQYKLSNLWKTYKNKPAALIYVLDTSTIEKYGDNFIDLFDRLMNFYTDPEYIAKNGETPLLILGNKIDLLENNEVGIPEIESLLKPTRFNAVYKIGMTSALKNIGILQNFRWIVSQLLDFGNCE